MAHTLWIIHHATPAKPGVLRVMFYGQSITSSKWTDLTTAHLRRRYPNVRFVVSNMAIGGFASTLLERVAARDLDEVQPDLIVFQDYGDHRAYERIIRMMRSRTAAEIIIQNDHVTLPIEPVCPVGLRLSWARPRGCTGTFWLRQHDWSERMSSVLLPSLATRYGLVIEPRRASWNNYLQQHHLSPDALLVDGLHPNASGWRLMAALFDGWFDHLVATTGDASQSLVRDLPPPPPGSTRSIMFEGTRVELVGDAPLAGEIRATVDGQAPRTLEGCWQVSRTTALPGVANWPAIKQVQVSSDLEQSESWTAVLAKAASSATSYRFSLSSDRRGPDGRGDTSRDFTSPSGRIHIAAADWDIGMAASALHVTEPSRFSVSWSRRFACGEELPVPLGGGRVEQRMVVATGLKNVAHRMRLSIAPGAQPLRAIEVYRPPLHSS